MKTNEDNFDYDTQSVRVFLKEILGINLPQVKGGNFTREDYGHNENEVNCPNKHNRHDRHETPRDSSKYKFIVVWQNYD